MTQSMPARTGEERSSASQKIQQMTPDKNAPMAVFLASHAARDVTGQVFGTRMNENYPFISPRPTRSLHRGEERLDARGDRRARLAGAPIIVYAARPVGGSILLGPIMEPGSIAATCPTGGRARRADRIGPSPVVVAQPPPAR